MLRNVQPSFVIQDKRSGLFLTEELGFSRLLKLAGRLHDYDEALDTAVDNFESGEFEICMFWELL